MLDTNIWTSKFGDNNFADYVIGGPTLEMLVASWNTKYPEDKIYCNGTGNYISSYKSYLNKYGYFVGRESGSTEYSQYIKTSDSTYVITSTDKIKGYWLASPSASYDSNLGQGNAVMYVNHSGGVGNCSMQGYWEEDYYYGINMVGYGFRPLVCLSSNVKLVSNGNGTYSLTKQAQT